MRIEQLTADHRDAILEFETVNRAYFSAAVPDRGEAFFAAYPARHEALLALQAARTDIFHVLIAEDGAIAGRVNLIDIAGAEAELGYRIGRDFAGRGLATEAVGRVCHLAATDYGLKRLRAVTTADNPASRAVLLRNGFVIVSATTLNGRPGHRFAREL